MATDTSIVTDKWTDVQSLRTLLPANLWYWLGDSGSTTAKMARFAKGDWCNEVLSSQWQAVQADEVAPLGLPGDAQFWVREVILSGRQKPWIWGRTLFPENSVKVAGHDFTQLGECSLGKVLFTDPHLKREKIQLRYLAAHHCLIVHLTQQLQIKPVALWARRSVFYFHQQPLLLYEVFLPAVFHCSEGSSA